MLEIGADKMSVQNAGHSRTRFYTELRFREVLNVLKCLMDDFYVRVCV